MTEAVPDSGPLGWRIFQAHAYGGRGWTETVIFRRSNSRLPIGYH